MPRFSATLLLPNRVSVSGVVTARSLKPASLAFFSGCKFLALGNGTLMSVASTESEKERESGRGGVTEGRKKVELW